MQAMQPPGTELCVSSVIGLHALSRSVYFFAVRGALHLSDKYYPGSLRKHLWTTVAYRSYFSRFYTSTFWMSYWIFMFWEIANHLLWMLFVKGRPSSGTFLRYSLASNRLGELETYRSLFTINDAQLIPDSLLRLCCCLGENLNPDTIRGYRRFVASRGIRGMVTEINSCSTIWRELCLQTASSPEILFFRMILHFLEEIIIPRTSVWLGGKLASSIATPEDVKTSGATYNSAQVVYFLVINSWMLIRITLLPKILSRVFPQVAVPESPPCLPELDKIESITRVFSGKNQQELAAIEEELIKAAAGTPTSIRVVQNASRDGTQITPDQAKHLLQGLHRHYRRSQLVVDQFRSNTTVASTTLAAQLQKEGQQCCICMKDFTVESHIRQLPCKHPFCSSCIEQWVLKEAKDVCPLCMSKVLVHGPLMQNIVYYAIHALQCFLSVSLPRCDPGFIDDLQNRPGAPLFLKMLLRLV
eukprot:TRINITY_DN4766_c0_g1_i1.p1 TRINITY_DN4766_c0_g1~~TRINITY_DN4766_c0_g1_i1.p1  ORF type:complete len:472 (+),score=55.00 TRINITY_DN4766_c0_g1_i1:1809-3224(+)